MLKGLVWKLTNMYCAFEIIIFCQVLHSNSQLLFFLCVIFSSFRKFWPNVLSIAKYASCAIRTCDYGQDFCFFFL